MNVRKIKRALLSLLFCATVSIASGAYAGVTIVSGLQDNVGNGIGPGGQLVLNYFGVSQLVISDVDPDSCYFFYCNRTLRIDGVYTPRVATDISGVFNVQPGYVLDPSLVNTNPSELNYGAYLDYFRIFGQDYDWNVGSNLLIPFIYNGGGHWAGGWLDVTIVEPDTGHWTLALNGYGYDDSGAAVVVGVPEPETYAMLLAGLGLLGFVARRRKQKTA